VDPVTFYVSWNAANNDGSTSGDYIYTDSLVVWNNAVTEGGVESGFATDLRLFPNPATGGTAVLYALPENALVQVELVTPSGRIVRRLVDRSHVAGRYALYWTREGDVSGGIYFVLLKIDGVVVKKVKLVLMGEN
jgi:hypothetical protein